MKIFVNTSKTDYIVDKKDKSNLIFSDCFFLKEIIH